MSCTAPIPPCDSLTGRLTMALDEALQDGATLEGLAIEALIQIGAELTVLEQRSRRKLSLQQALRWLTQELPT